MQGNGFSAPGTQLVEMLEVEADDVHHSQTKQGKHHRAHRFWIYSILDLRYLAATAPLVAAFISPLSFILDIPALSQNWFIDVPTPPASLGLSVVGLAFDAVGNGLLLSRFATTEFANRHWRILTNLSALSWFLKNILAIVNIALYTRGSYNGQPTVKTEGWWAALLSICLSGLINILLLSNVAVINTAMGKSSRTKGGKYLRSLMALVSLLALEALAFSQIEGWTYVDALYFSVVSCLTIGFGDYSVKGTGGRALLFFFLIFSIILLAQFISVAQDYASEAIQRRRARWVVKYEQVQFKEALEKDRPGTLDEEMALLRKLNRDEESRWQRQDMIIAIAALGIFWLIGAGLFSWIEGWAYSKSMYFAYCVFLTVGVSDTIQVFETSTLMLVVLTKVR